MSPEPPPVSPQKAQLEIKGLTVQFQRRDSSILVLDEIDLTVPEGEFMCIVGPSGCGKTTLLNVIAGLLRPTSGEVILDGRQITSAGRDRAVVFQSDAVFPWMTVEKNIRFALKSRRLSAYEENMEVERFLKMVDLEPFADAWPRELSGGMRKRADLARALAAHPDLLLMDEPFASVDVQTKEQLQAETQRLWMEYTYTTIFVTHDLEEAIYLGTRVIVLSNRPARPIFDMRIEEPIPRSPVWKLEPAFVELRRQLREQLRPSDYGQA